jgi:hypothetical protein
MKLGSLVSEIQLESKLGDEFADIGDELAQELTDELENQEQVNEVVLSIVAYVMLSNGIMGLLSKLVKRISKKYDFGKGQAAAEKIENFVKANDKRFMFPIRKAVGLFTKDEKQINKVTHILFALVVLLMAFNAGIEVFDLIKDSEFMQSSVNSLRTAVGGTKVHALARTVTKLL